MNFEVFVTCAVTGAGDTVGRHPGVPVTPREIADAAIEAARAGAAIAHIHVRDPETGKAARQPPLYRQVCEMVRESGVDVVLNLTAGMGGDVVFGAGEQPLPLDPAGTDMVGPLERLAHVEECLPEICTLDCGTMNFSLGDYVMTNTPSSLRTMARRVQALGVRPELEVFDTGHLVFVKQLIKEGLLDDPIMIQLCMGIPYGAPDDPLDLDGAGAPVAAGIGVQRLLDRKAPAAVRRDGRARRRQCPGRTGGQSVPRQRPARDQRSAGRARGHHRRGDGRQGAGPGPGPREAEAEAARMIRQVGLVGGGVIGAGWAARFLLNGSDVAIFDPDPEIERKTEAVLANARRAWAKLFPSRKVIEGRVSFVGSPEEAVTGADFIQESLPEREELKIRVLAAIDRAARPAAVIGSSTSGLLPTRLQSEMAHPERLVVGHPFNPVYLLPLVEICGGEQTSAETKTRAAEIYTAIGMHPLHVRKEIDGFIADRLLEAVWREALWLVNDGVATTSEIDDAIRYGAGLRWSFMGTFLIYRLAGGEAGMRHFLSQFGPALKLPWTKLVAPELSDELSDRIAAQSDEQAGGQSIRALETLRDDCLVSVLSALRDNDFAAGHTLKMFHVKHSENIDGPLRLLETSVKPEWIDYNGHMTEHRYLDVFGQTTDQLLAHLGADPAYGGAGFMYYTVETHIRHLHEVAVGEKLYATTQILGADEKRIHLFHSLHKADDTLLATGEQMLLHVDTKAGKAVPAKGAVLEAVQKLAAAHADLAAPDGAGRHIALPAKR